MQEQIEMTSIRMEIDSVDEQVVALLARRFALTHRVGELKAAIGEAPLNAARQAQRRQFLERLAVTHRVESRLIMDLFARIQKETLASHARLAGQKNS
jgi:chorismate mutase